MLVLLFLPLVCFVIAFLQYKEIGFVLNNKFLYATKKQREEMNKKPYYRQSAITFFSIGCILLMEIVDIITNSSFIHYLAIFATVALIVYAIVSSIVIEKKIKEEKR